MKFVIQKHKSSNGRTTYYLRLEKDGVLKGWAVPKGLPEKGGKQHLAIEVGPFKLEAAGFEGKVEKSKFGPGMITVLDRGEYRVRSWEDDKIIFDLSGSRAKGSFALILFPKAGPLHWLLGQTHGASATILPAQKSAMVNKKPGRTTSVHQRKPRLTYKKPTRIKKTSNRKSKVRFIKRAKSPYRTGYTAYDWMLLLAFIIFGLILLARDSQ